MSKKLSVGGVKIDAGAQTILALGAVAALAVWYSGRQVAKAAEAVGTAVNPVDRDNVVNSGVDAVGKAVTGDDGWTLGGWFFDVTHPDAGWNPDVESEL